MADETVATPAIEHAVQEAPTTEQVQETNKVALSPLVEAVRRPIPGEKPCGVDVTYNDDFLKLKAEIDKIGTVSAKVDQEKAVADAKQLKGLTGKQLREQDKLREKGDASESKGFVSEAGGVNYYMIIEVATTILSEKSKDLRVASYLALALWRTQKYVGLAEGMKVLLVLTQEFWDGLYPASVRLAARRGALEFLIQRLSDGVDGATVAAEDREPLEQARGAMAELQTELAKRIPENPPSLLGLTKAMEHLLGKIPKPVPKPRTDPANPAAVDASQGVSSQAPSLPGELRTPQEATESIRRVATFLRSQNRRSATPFRLMRSVRWDGIAAEPGNDNGKTKMEAPPLQRRTYLKGLFDGGQWEKLVDECEASFAQPFFYFWLDMQRITVGALNALGSEYQTARSAVLLELAVLLQRVPKLQDLTFGDGTRFAEPATRDWIVESVLPVLGSGGATGMTASTGEGELGSRVAEAKAILDKGDLAGALACLQNGSVLDTSRKIRFLRQLNMAMLCMRGNQPAIARPILEDLQGEIERYSIHEWEPALALETWTNLHKCYQYLAAAPTTADKKSFQQNADQVFEKICRLDVRYALAASGIRPKSRPQADEASAGVPPAGGNEQEKES